MSGPQRVTDWNALAVALAASGCDLTEYGEALAGPRRVCCFCKADLGPAGPGFTGDTHGMHEPPCPEAITMGWGDARE